MDWGWQGQGDRGLEFPEGGEQVAVSPDGRARIRYNTALGLLEQSLDGAAYELLGGSGLGYTLNWGANLSTLSNFAAANGTTTGTQSAATNVASDHVMPGPGRLTQFTASTLAADATTRITIFVDGVPAGPAIALTASGPQLFPISPPIVVPAGQVVSVQYSAGTAPGRSIYSVLVEQ